MLSTLLLCGTFVVQPPPTHVRSGRSSCSTPAGVSMLFGNKDGGAGGGMNMMETIKKAQQVGVKVKELQEELVNTEIEATAANDGVTVTISGAQVPISESVEYAKTRMVELYGEIGLPMPGAPPPS